jgi:hypothetical protein
MSPAIVRRGVTKIRRLYEFVSYAFLHLQPRLQFFFLANQTSFKDEVLLTEFFIDDQFFDINFK